VSHEYPIFLIYIYIYIMKTKIMRVFSSFSRMRLGFNTKLLRSQRGDFASN